MTYDAISKFIARGEGSTLEFKRSLKKDFGREPCAFGNADGRPILIGVLIQGSSSDCTTTIELGPGCKSLCGCRIR